jgi:hypothetical protein
VRRHKSANGRLSATRDAQPGQDVLARNHSRGLGTARLRTQSYRPSGLPWRQAHQPRRPSQLRRHVRPSRRPVTRHPHAVERLVLRRRSARRKALVQTAVGLGDRMKSHPAGMRLGTGGRMGPRRRLRQSGRGELGTQRRPGDQGNEQAQRGDNGDGQLPSQPSTSAP